uniref:Methyltransferase domain-containing protein n=1 Tax=Candidatus Kentrum sp. LPFa TaxID=2126335 RepID=A0A450XF21_9GAMM|nr:MAG: Methyltransferase domain-containing protein [Candidatus Kentron sp. LPFa]VFK27890.1 MAG: Methyltransferase domain-containing protein [Candidatus Kentron sp. LPFa]
MIKPKYEITFPQETGDRKISQGQEYFLVDIDGLETRIGLHDYKTIYRYPWLYDIVLYDFLGCKTPSGMCDIIHDLFTDLNVDRQRLHMLEIGAGSGIFAENLRDRVGITDISGLDLYEIAKVAAERDRPNLYRKYYVADLTDLSPDLSDELARQQFNCVGLASATGWGNHIPLDGFEQAFNLLAPDGWFIFHVKPNDPDPECVALNQWIYDKIRSKQLDLKTKQSCFHRYSMDEKAIYYDVLVGVKQSFE